MKKKNHLNCFVRHYFHVISGSSKYSSNPYFQNSSNNSFAAILCIQINYLKIQVFGNLYNFKNITIIDYKILINSEKLT